MRRIPRTTHQLGFALIACTSLLMIAGCTQFDGGMFGSSSSGSDSSLLVRRTQSLLNDLGYDAGPADGVVGTRTSVAIRDYQRDMGLKQDGVASWSLVANLQDRSHSQVVNYIQVRLATLGYFHGQPDGQDDSATRDAIRAYQSSNGMASDGRITPALLHSLQIPEGVHTASESHAGPPSVSVSAAPNSDSPDGSRADDRRLAPGDHVTIRVVDPAAGGEVRHDLTIAQDGELALPDGGSVHAAGMRRPDLENAVALAILERHLRNLSVKVDVSQPTAQSGTSQP